MSLKISTLLIALVFSSSCKFLPSNDEPQSDASFLIEFNKKERPNSQHAQDKESKFIKRFKNYQNYYAQAYLNLKNFPFSKDESTRWDHYPIAGKGRELNQVSLRTMALTMYALFITNIKFAQNRYKLEAKEKVIEESKRLIKKYYEHYFVNSRNHEEMAFDKYSKILNLHGYNSIYDIKAAETGEIYHEHAKDDHAMIVRYMLSPINKKDGDYIIYMNVEHRRNKGFKKVPIEILEEIEKSVRGIMTEELESNLRTRIANNNFAKNFGKFYQMDRPYLFSEIQGNQYAIKQFDKIRKYLTAKAKQQMVQDSMYDILLGEMEGQFADVIEQSAVPKVKNDIHLQDKYLQIVIVMVTMHLTEVIAEKPVKKEVFLQKGFGDHIDAIHGEVLKRVEDDLNNLATTMQQNINIIDNPHSGLLKRRIINILPVKDADIDALKVIVRAMKRKSTKNNTANIISLSIKLDLNETTLGTLKAYLKKSLDNWFIAPKMDSGYSGQVLTKDERQEKKIQNFLANIKKTFSRIFGNTLPIELSTPQAD